MATVIFCDRFVDKRSRTHDQMVQAARSGRQNIAEGSMASATSKKTELKLTNVARASLEELLLDYEDFLRQRRLRLWDKNSREALAVRGRYQSAPTDSYDPHGIAKATAEVAANTLICLINQATYLLKRQVENQGRDFVEHGGFTERLYQARSDYKQRTGETTLRRARSARIAANPCDCAPRTKGHAPANRSGAAPATPTAPAPARRDQAAPLVKSDSPPTPRGGPT